MAGDVVSLIEAAYRIERTESDWLAGIAEAARPVFADGVGVASYTYDASDVTHLRLNEIVVRDGMEAWLPAEAIRRLAAGADPEYVRNTWRRVPFGLASESPGIELQPGWAQARAAGLADVIAVCGIDPSGMGCWLGTVLLRARRLRSRERATFARIAAHLAAGLRLRRALAAVQQTPVEAVAAADAVLDPGGHLKHARDDAQSTGARAALREAAVAIDRARGKLRHTEPQRAVEEWKGLVSGRWTLLDHFESDGRRYVLARRNEPEGAPLEKLTRRERQVVGYLAMGHSYKLIAYELGISVSTIGALVWRACNRLGVESREELVRMATQASEEPPRK